VSEEDGEWCGQGPRLHYMDLKGRALPNRKGSWEKEAGIHCGGMQIWIITHGPEGERCARGEKRGD
jgi:hypothetical protein